MSKLKPQEWMVEIENGIEYRKEFGKEKYWDLLERTYYNEPNSMAKQGANLIYEMGDSLLSSINDFYPDVMIEPSTPQGVKNAPLIERLDNILMRQLDLREVVKLASLNNYLNGKAILKIGYDSEFGWSPYYDLGSSSLPLGMTMTQFDKQGQRIEFGSATPGMPWVAAVHPKDFVVPYGTTSLEEAPWCAHRVIRLNSDLKKDPKYKNTSGLQPQMSMETFVDSYKSQSSKQPRKMSVLAQGFNKEPLFNEIWEIHDRRTGKVFVVTQDFDKFLRDEVDALQETCGLPFVAEGFVSNTRHFWSPPLAFYLTEVQIEQADIAKQIVKQRRLSNVKFLARKNDIDVDELNKVTSSDNVPFCFVNRAVNLNDVVKAFPTGSVIDLTLHKNLNQDYAKAVIGFSPNQMGNFDNSSRRTAREAMLVQSGAATRQRSKLDCNIRLYKQTIQKVNGIVFRWWNQPIPVQTSGQWSTIIPTQLKGQYHYDIELSSKRIIGRAARKMEAMQMMFQLAQIPGIDLKSLYQYVLDASGDVAFEDIFNMEMGRQPSQIQGTVKGAGESADVQPQMQIVQNQGG